MNPNTLKLAASLFDDMLEQELITNYYGSDRIRQLRDELNDLAGIDLAAAKKLAEIKQLLNN